MGHLFKDIEFLFFENHNLMPKTIILMKIFGCYIYLIKNIKESGKREVRISTVNGIIIKIIWLLYRDL